MIVVLVYQQFENYVLQPTIVGRAADVPGFFVIASVLVFGGLFGVAGAILGVPIFAAVQIIVREVTGDRREDIARAEAASDGGGPFTPRSSTPGNAIATHSHPNLVS